MSMINFENLKQVNPINFDSLIDFKIKENSQNVKLLVDLKNEVYSNFQK
jgi:hypothetical protein